MSSSTACDACFLLGPPAPAGGYSSSRTPIEDLWELPSALEETDGYLRGGILTEGADRDCRSGVNRWRQHSAAHVGGAGAGAMHTLPGSGKETATDSAQVAAMLAELERLILQLPEDRQQSPPPGQPRHCPAGSVAACGVGIDTSM